MVSQQVHHQHKMTKPFLNVIRSELIIIDQGYSAIKR